MASKQAHPGCLVLFGLFFVVMGSIPGCIALADLRTAQAADGWVETTAVLLHVGVQHGDETWSVEARYRYRAPDPESLEPGALRDYEGTRVGVHEGSDNVGSWQADTLARLETAWKAEEPVPCWYDPADPASAVLDRGERWELLGFMFIFPLVFGAVGGGIAWFGVHLWRQRGRPPPDQQALARQGAIRATGGGGCVLWIFAVFWNGISLMVPLLLWPDPEAPRWAKLLFGLFPLIGVVLLWAALHGSLRRLRHGTPELRLEGGGAWLAGRRVRATVLVRAAPQAGERVTATLAVVRRVTTSSSDGDSTREDTQWSVDLAVDPAAARNEGGRWAHVLDLPLPSDLPLPEAGGSMAWRLEWRMQRAGPDLVARFELPVAAGDDGAVLVADEVKQAIDRADPLAVLRRAGVRVEEERGAVVVELPAWRNPGLHLTGLVASLVLSGGAAALVDGVGWWTLALSAPLAALAWRGALRSALWRSRIAIAPGRIEVASGWWRIVRHELAAGAIAEVRRSTSMSSNNHAWYNIHLRTGDGAEVAVARGLGDEASARLQQLIEAVRR